MGASHGRRTGSNAYRLLEFPWPASHCGRSAGGVVSQEQASPQLTVLVERRKPWAIVRLSGALDYQSHPDLADHLNSLLNEMDPPRICLDLNGLHFFDSSGLACVVMAWRVAGERGGTLVLQRPAGEVARLLSLFGLAAIVPVVDEPPG
jgi:anti-anti-sigma factor